MDWILKRAASGAYHAGQTACGRMFGTVWRAEDGRFSATASVHGVPAGASAITGLRTAAEAKTWAEAEARRIRAAEAERLSADSFAGLRAKAAELAREAAREAARHGRGSLPVASAIVSNRNGDSARLALRSLWGFPPSEWYGVFREVYSAAFREAMAEALEARDREAAAPEAVAEPVPEAVAEPAAEAVAEPAAAWEASADHFDSCLPCYLAEHTGEGRIILGASYGPQTTWADVAEEWLSELESVAEAPEGFTEAEAEAWFTALRAAVAEEAAGLPSGYVMDESDCCDWIGDREGRAEDETESEFRARAAEEGGDDESPSAWIRVTWEPANPAAEEAEARAEALAEDRGRRYRAADKIRAAYRAEIFAALVAGGEEAGPRGVYGCGPAAMSAEYAASQAVSAALREWTTAALEAEAARAWRPRSLAGGES